MRVINKTNTLIIPLTAAIFISIFSPLKSNDLNSEGVSIIVATMRQEYMDMVFENYSKQDYPKKELIVVLNKNSMDINQWREKAQEFENVKVYQVDEDKNLGTCLNVGVEKAKYNFIAKMDDDDYYSSKHISKSMAFFDIVDTDVVGKTQHFLLFDDSNTLALRLLHGEYDYSTFVIGGTLVIKRNVLEKIRFNEEIPFYIDGDFCKQCRQNGFKIYSTDIYGFCQIRRKNVDNHTYKVNKEKILKSCRIVHEGSENMEDIEIFIGL